MVGGLDDVRAQLPDTGSLTKIPERLLETHRRSSGRFPYHPEHSEGSAFDLTFSMRSFRFLLSAIAFAAACDRAQTVKVAQAAPDSARADSIARARQDSINRAQPGYIVDSVLPVEEELRRFRAAIGGTPVTALTNGSPSRRALAQRFVDAVAKNDTNDIRAMTITAREFADLVYPTSPFTHPPYRQPPGLVWTQITRPSESGLKRLIARRGLQAFRFESVTCKNKPDQQGQNTLWQDCSLHLVNPAHETVTERWFGSIIERGGTFKLVSLTNQY